MPGSPAEKIATGLRKPADLAVDPRRNLLLVPENQGNRLVIYQLQRNQKG